MHPRAIIERDRLEPRGQGSFELQQGKIDRDPRIVGKPRMNGARLDPLQNMRTVFGIGDDDIAFSRDAMRRREDDAARHDAAGAGIVPLPRAPQHHDEMGR